MQYRNDKSGAPLSILGYGCMRFSRKGGAIFKEQFAKAAQAGRDETHASG